MAFIERTIENTSGIPLGGIGTGSVEIREDGLFHEWQVFNVGRWSPQSPAPACCGGKQPIPTMRPEDFTFIIRTESDSDGVKVRRLAMREQLNNLYSFAWLKCVESIRYRGEFPVARLEYADDTLPVEVKAEVFGPFIPHQPRESATPGFYVRFAVRSLADEPVRVSILATLANPIPCGERVHTLHKDGPTTMITLGAAGVGADEPHNGSLTLGVTGGEHSYVLGTFEQERGGFMVWDNRLGISARSCLKDFRRTGRLANLPATRAPERFADDFKAADLAPAERKKLLAKLLKHSIFYHKHQRVVECDPKLFDKDGLIAFLDICAEETRKNLSKDTWRDARLCSSLTLEPQQESGVQFTLGWFFPNHISPKSGNIGHMYANWFGSSLDVCRYLVANAADFRARTIAFANTLFNTSLDYFLADSIAAQLSTMVKCTWWTRDNDFGVWEGLGCCGFHTTDITYDGSFPIIALFPSLQKQQMIMGARHQRDDGRIPHFFIPDFSQTDGDYARVDMNPQFVLLVARDYLWTGDRAFLRTIWKPVIDAIENTRLLDADGDGLPDHDCERQTYDAWSFYGCPSYIASLWLASLKAGIRLAAEMKDARRAARWRAWYVKGIDSFEKLWNGEYYVLWKEMQKGGRVDECCMTDQIDGDWFTALMGWGNVLPVDRIRTALQSIFRYNYSSEVGLQNATYPPGKKRRITTYDNIQQEAPWTGIEYAIASMFIDYGLVAEGIEIVRNVYERYLRAGRIWNHVECGDHYYRAMSSWGLLLALTGFRVDEPARKLTIAPAIRHASFRAPFASSTAWGSYSHEIAVGRTTATVECLGGALGFRTLALGLPLEGGAVTAKLDGSSVPCSAKQSGGVLELSFRKQIEIPEGGRLEIVIA